jgi:predicted RNase H-like nuclease (RuvC/YqgF family)
MIHKFCIRNQEDRCIQCRDYAPKKRVCPAYRILLKQAPELLEHLRHENERLTRIAQEMTETNQRLRQELVAANRTLFREEISGVVN